jgi:hypothetical protein
MSAARIFWDEDLDDDEKLARLESFADECTDTDDRIEAKGYIRAMYLRGFERTGYAQYVREHRLKQESRS